LTLLFEASATGSLDAGDTLSWTVWAVTEGLSDTGYFGGFVGSFAASDPAFGEVTNIVSHMAGEGTAARGEGAHVVDLNIFNSALLGTNDPANPLRIVSFDVVLGPESEGATLSYGATGIATLFASGFMFAPPIEMTVFRVVSDTYPFVPGPGGTVCALAAGGLGVSRRRRG
jgi:hypothetical protein